MSGTTVSKGKFNWRLPAWACHQSASSIISMAMAFASYLATGSYGIAVFAAGLIASGTRIFDAAIDPFLALITDRLSTRFGRVRIMIVVGRAIQILCIMGLFFWGIGKGAVLYTVIYCVYYVGASISAIASHTGNPVITTSPKERPIIFRWMMIYTTCITALLTFYRSKYLFVKHGGLNLGAFQELALTACAVVVVMEFIACIAITEKDVPGSFPKKANGKSVNFIDMFRLLTGNRAMQMYVIAGVSDKIASQVVRQAAISTLVFGIVIGNYEFSGTFSLIKILPTILLLFYGSHLAGKYGTKKALVQWSAISIVCAVLMIGFMAVIDPTSVSINPVTTGLFIVLYLAYMCCSNVVSSCTNAMVPDIVDYELYRTGSFLPGTVGTLYSLIDELISSSADTILALCLTLIGYVSVQPQPGDACTSSVFWMTMFLWMGLPILGWLCTLIAMKWYPLDKEKMAEVQEKNAAFRAAQKDQREANAK